MQIIKLLILFIMLFNCVVSSQMSIMKSQRRHRITKKTVKKTKMTKRTYKHKVSGSFPSYPTDYGYNSVDPSVDSNENKNIKEYTPLQKILYGAIGVIDAKTHCGNALGFLLNLPPIVSQKSSINKQVVKDVKTMAEWAQIKVVTSNNGEDIGIEEIEYQELDGGKFLPGHSFKSKLKGLVSKAKAKINVALNSVKEKLSDINTYFENIFGKDNWDKIKAALTCIAGLSIMIGSTLLAGTGSAAGVGIPTIVLSSIKFLLALKKFIDAMKSQPKDYIMIGRSLANMAMAFLSVI